MSGRLNSRILIGALLRQAQAHGGTGTVLHKGEPLSGTIVVQVMQRGQTIGLFEPRGRPKAPQLAQVACGRHGDRSSQTRRRGADRSAERRNNRCGLHSVTRPTAQY